MSTALLLTNFGETKRQFEMLLGNRVSFIEVAPPAESSREKFDALFATWLRLADLVILDGLSLGETTRWAIESLSETGNGTQPIIFRASLQQRQSLLIPRQWHVVLSSDPDEQLEQSLKTFLDLCDAKTRLSRAAAPARAAISVPGAGANVPFDGYRYRDALKTLSRLLGKRHSERELLDEFLRLVRELLSIGKMAVFTRRIEEGLFVGQSTPSAEQLTVSGSVGIAPTVAEHLRLALNGGIGGWLSREVRILRRGQVSDDDRIEREFDLLGTEVAVPMFDNDQLIGVLSFSGKITGEALLNEELELVYQLLSQLAQALRNLHLNDRIAAHQKLISEVLANIHSGVLVVDKDERILAINDYARQMLELSNRNLVGQDLDQIPGRVGDVVFESLRLGAPVAEREVLLPRVNRPLRVCVTRFEQADTKHAVVVALIEDLTQAKLEQARARESADREFLMRLAFRLSHELKNSLVSIKIFSQLLPERYEEKEFREQFSSIVTNEVNRVDVLVNNLTFFSHPLGLVHEEINLTDLLDACVKNVTQEFNRKQLVQVLGVGEKPAEGSTLPVVTVRKTMGHKLAKVEGDKLRLMQAIEHVLRNALQAVPSGGRVSINTTDAVDGDLAAGGRLPAGGAVKIEIQDSGEGIALENLRRVTEPFFTTRNVGVGLGLTIVKKIVARHSGRLDVDSLLGSGTTVKIVMPVKAQPHPEDALLQHLAKQASATEEFGEPSVAPNRLPKPVRPESGERS
jgi:signal transduction histidine kinase